MDVDTIPAGVDFRKHLHDAVADCEIVVVVIGRDWLKRHGLFRKRRLDNPRDFVRIEIEAALQRDIRVIPVLVRDADMPSPEDLPASIQDLAYRNAVWVRAGRDFHTDIGRLIRELEAPPPRAEVSSPVTPQPAFSPASLPLVEPPRETGRNEVVSSGEVLTNSIGMSMVLIPAGAFLMGSPDSDEYASDSEKPQHGVRITRPFYFGVFPVTQEEYELVTGTNPSRFWVDKKRPVEQVSWGDAVEFCQRLSEKEGKEYRLPSEAEWEYACRARSMTRWCFGDSESDLGDYAWCYTNSGSTTHPVGEKKPNAWGLRDMHGNVWEWCADWYNARYYGNSPPNDPTGPASGSGRVCRGGCWYDGARSCRSAHRYVISPTYKNSDMGFRVCLHPAE